jgi:hypothetical protein
MREDHLHRDRPTYDPAAHRTGAGLERFVYDYLERAIGTSSFPFIRECCRLHRGKRYRSPSRQALVPCDVTVEVFLSGQSEYSLLWVWECKDWSRTVGVPVLKAFHAKLQELGEDKTKGTLAVCNGVTQPAYHYARHHGIGIWKVQVSSGYTEGDVKNYLPIVRPGEGLSGKFWGANKLFYAGNDVGFIPPDQVNVSHIDTGLPEFLSTCLERWLGSDFDATEDCLGWFGVVLRYADVQ